jgi:hypothetical protein
LEVFCDVVTSHNVTERHKTPRIRDVVTQPRRSYVTDKSDHSTGEKGDTEVGCDAVTLNFPFVTGSTPCGPPQPSGFSRRRRRPDPPRIGCDACGQISLRSEWIRASGRLPRILLVDLRCPRCNQVGRGNVRDLNSWRDVDE